MKILIVYNTVEYVWYRRFFLRELIARGDEVVAVAPFDAWREKVESSGIRCVDWQLTRWGANPVRELRALWKLYRIMRDERPDATILYTIKPVIYGSIAGKFVPGMRIFSLVTGLGFMFVNAGLFGGVRQFAAKSLYRLALRSNENVFFQNPDDFEVFVENGIVPENQAILVPGSGVDTEHFKPSEQAADEAHFLLASRMLWDKGVALFVNAARRLRRKYPDAIFTLLGPLDENPAAIPGETLKQWNDEGIVRYVGAVDDVRPYMALCSVYVLPSSYREGIPRTNLEALAMGKPIITTDMPGCRETVIPEVNGYMISPGDEDALVDAMEKFLRDRELAGRMGQESRKLAVKRFRVENINKVFLEALESDTT